MTLKVVKAGALEPQAEVVQLPSQEGTDDAVRLKKASVLSMMNEDGQITDLITKLVFDDNELSDEDGIKMLPDVQRLDAFMNQVAIACFVEPAMQEQAEPDEGYASVHWLAFSDKVFVLTWALGEQFNKLATFRQE